MSRHRHTAARRDLTPSMERLTPVNSWDEVPAFANECEEHVYWSTHCLGPGLLDQLGTLDDPALPAPRGRLPR